MYQRESVPQLGTAQEGPGSQVVAQKLSDDEEMLFEVEIVVSGARAESNRRYVALPSRVVLCAVHADTQAERERQEEGGGTNLRAEAR